MTAKLNPIGGLVVAVVLLASACGEQNSQVPQLADRDIAEISVDSVFRSGDRISAFSLTNDGAANDVVLNIISRDGRVAESALTLPESRSATSFPVGATIGPDDSEVGVLIASCLHGESRDDIGFCEAAELHYSSTKGPNSEWTVLHVPIDAERSTYLGHDAHVTRVGDDTFVMVPVFSATDENPGSLENMRWELYQSKSSRPFSKISSGPGLPTGFCGDDSKSIAMIHLAQPTPPIDQTLSGKALPIPWSNKTFALTNVKEKTTYSDPTPEVSDPSGGFAGPWCDNASSTVFVVHGGEIFALANGVTEATGTYNGAFSTIDVFAGKALGYALESSNTIGSIPLNENSKVSDVGEPANASKAWMLSSGRTLFEVKTTDSASRRLQIR